MRWKHNLGRRASTCQVWRKDGQGDGAKDFQRPSWGPGHRGLLLCLLPTQQHTCLPCPIPSEQAFVGRPGKLTVKVYNHNSMAKMNSRCEEFDL